MKIPVTQIFIYGVKANLTYSPATITPGFPNNIYEYQR